MNYAEIDKKNMLEFIVAHGGVCDVEDILECDNIEKLRVYPLIYRLKEEGVLDITEYDSYGAPLKVKLV